MKIKNFELTAIDAERYSKKGAKKGNIKINHNSSVTRMEKMDANTTHVDFRFTANYSGMGKIKIEGSFKIIGEYPDLAEKWQKENKMPNEVAKKVHTTIINNCIPEAVGLAKNINLPPPIPLPKVNVSEDKSNTTSPKGGMEVA